MTKSVDIKIGIQIIESTDPSVQCIHALQQVMNYFEYPNNSTVRKLSIQGKDKQAVYAWFVNRYGPSALTLTLNKEVGK